MLRPCEIIAIVWVFGYTYAGSTVPCAFADTVPAGVGHTTGATKPQNKVTSATLDKLVAVEYKPSSDVKDNQHVALIPGESGNGTFPSNATCPAMVSRAEWHARDPIYNNQTEVKTFLQYPLRYMVYTQTLTGTTVHGTCTDRESCKKTVKAIQDDHMGFSPSSTTKFADIAYNFLIGMDGSVFEGRGWLLKGAYYKPLNTQGIGVAFIGTFPEAGTSVAPMSYEAILAAHQLLRCAISMEYVVSVNYSVIAVRLSPTASQYIDNPDTFPRNPPTAGPMLTPGETAVVSIACSVALVFGIVVAICIRKNARASAEQERLINAARRTTDYQSAIQGGLYPQGKILDNLGSDCLYVYSHRDSLGQGSYGHVYRARIVHRGNYTGEEEAAVKVINETKVKNLKVNSERSRDRWVTLLSLQCPHLVAFHRVSFFSTNTGFSVEILMDLCEGGDLERLLLGMKADLALLDQGSALCYALQIVTGVEFLHAQHLRHGDLKPGNIFLKHHADRHAAVVIGDLDGLEVMGNNTASETHADMNVGGTLKYMAPEIMHIGSQEQPPAPSRKADVWSVGCIMHDLFDRTCGIHIRKYKKSDPLPGESGTFTMDAKTTQHQFAVRIMAGYVPFVSEEIAPALADIIRPCLNVDYSKRPSAEDLRRSVLQSLGHIATHHDPTSMSQKDVIRKCICGQYLLQNGFDVSCGRLVAVA